MERELVEICSGELATGWWLPCTVVTKVFFRWLKLLLILYSFTLGSVSERPHFLKGPHGLIYSLMLADF